ncbi:MAG: hypothetical protein JOZ90_00385 [Alphaproteobacteria bacterium]|nr:hypothetical protein [Alphaproteobacteria bacterium]MBV9370992.1 hypothetical protein [Alphaproteobacteria bacterium]MBV9899535.1 hypothetical protein [Alphaproteobacteria bacterium]
MKTAAFAVALLIGSAAMAQTAQTAGPAAAYDGDGVATAAWETDGTATAEAAMPAAAWQDAGATTAVSAVVQPGNSAPERDARGIPVISAAATVPAGWNGIAGTGEAMGGPLLDPATGEAVADPAAAYPACTRTVTDHCLQTYERGRRG